MYNLYMLVVMASCQRLMNSSVLFVLTPSSACGAAYNASQVKVSNSACSENDDALGNLRSDASEQPFQGASPLIVNACRHMALSLSLSLSCLKDSNALLVLVPMLS